MNRRMEGQKDIIRKLIGQLERAGIPEEQVLSGLGLSEKEYQEIMQ